MKPWHRVLLIIIPYFIIVGVFQLIGIAVSGLDPMHIHHIKTTEQHLIVSFFTLIGTGLVLWIFMKLVDEEPFVNLGFVIKNRFKDIVYGTVLGLIIMGLGYILLTFIDEIHFVKTHFNPKEVFYSIIVFSIVAFVEEMLFRGYVLRNLMYSFNNYVALMISSILFSLMHGFNPNMDWFSYLDLFLAGILLGASYIYTKNLWFPIALHFSWNFFQTLFGFHVSGQDFYSLIEFKITENNLWNGGAFGFEGSILSIVAQVVVITSIFIYYNRRKKRSNKPI